MQRVLTGLLLAITAGVLAAVVYVIGHHSTVPNAGQTPGYTAAPTAIPTLRASSSAPNLPSGSTSAPTAPLIPTAFLGDGYTLGTGGSSRQPSWTTLVSEALNLQPAVIGENGVGYARTAPNGDTYANLVAAAVKSKPDLIVVSGGRGDVIDSTQTLQDAAKALFAQLHARLPHATLVAIEPIWGDSSHPSKLTPVDRAVKAGVLAANGRYLAIVDPLRGHRDWMANEAVPNDLGYRAIAATVASALRPHLPSQHP